MKEVFNKGSDAHSWMIFAIPFLVRPFGSVFFGWIGDRFGRTVSLNLAIWGMALATVLQGCLPAGQSSVWMLAVLRIVSGLSAGGEAAGVNTYMTEVGGKDGEQIMAAAVGVNNVSGSLAFFVANVVSLAVHQLSTHALLSWGWRVPFLLAAPVGLVSIIMRRRLRETEDFEAVKEAREREGIDDHEEGSCFLSTRAIVLVVLVCAAINSCNYLPVYLCSWLRTNAGLTNTAALSITAVAKLTQLFMTFPASFAGDRFGATATVLIGGFVTAVCVIPALIAVTRADGAVTVAFVVLGLILPMCISVYLVPSNLYMTSLFPAKHRGRGAGVGLGLASVVGGLTPLISQKLVEKGALWPAVFIVAITIPSLLTLLWSRWAVKRGKLHVYQRAWLF